MCDSFALLKLIRLALVEELCLCQTCAAVCGCSSKCAETRRRRARDLLLRVARRVPPLPTRQLLGFRPFSSTWSQRSLPAPPELPCSPLS